MERNETAKCTLLPSDGLNVQRHGEGVEEEISTGDAWSKARSGETFCDAQPGSPDRGP